MEHNAEYARLKEKILGARLKAKFLYTMNIGRRGELYVTQANGIAIGHFFIDFEDVVKNFCQLYNIHAAPHKLRVRECSCGCGKYVVAPTISDTFTVDIFDTPTEALLHLIDKEKK